MSHCLNWRSIYNQLNQSNQLKKNFKRDFVCRQTKIKCFKLINISHLKSKEWDSGIFSRISDPHNGNIDAKGDNPSTQKHIPKFEQKTENKTFDNQGTTTHLHPLTPNQALRVREYPQHHVFDRALLLEDHPRQVQQHLVPFHL